MIKPVEDRKVGLESFTVDFKNFQAGKSWKFSVISLSINHWEKCASSHSTSPSFYYPVSFSFIFLFLGCLLIMSTCVHTLILALTHTWIVIVFFFFLSSSLFFYNKIKFRLFLQRSSIAHRMDASHAVCILYTHSGRRRRRREPIHALCTQNFFL